MWKTMRTDDLRVVMLSLHVHNQISLTFRFWEGAQVLDAGSYSNIRFLTRFIYRCHFEGREVVFVGFSDSQDSADGNLQISLDRARRAGDNCYNAGRNRAQGGLSGNRFG
jgi:phosphate transport system substrate-binding protein